VIARRIVERVESHIHPFTLADEDDPLRETVIKQIADDLRDVWEG